MQSRPVLEFTPFEDQEVEGKQRHCAGDDPPIAEAEEFLHKPLEDDPVACGREDFLKHDGWTGQEVSGNGDGVLEPGDHEKQRCGTEDIKSDHAPLPC